MLDIAIKHEQALKELFLNTWHNERYNFWVMDCWNNQYEAAKSTWERHEFVSLDSDGKVIGYIAYDIDRNTRSASGLSAVNFSDNKIIFGRDLFTAIKEVFTKFKFNKLDFSVVCGNPIERSYDRVTLRFGGRMVGVKKDHCRLIDGKYHDLKMYEILNSNRQSCEEMGR